MLDKLFWLVFVHFAADFPLQDDHMAITKTRHSNDPIWVYSLIAHGFMHGGGVFWVTGVLWIGIVETIIHIAIDFLKSEGRIKIHLDQQIHLLMKLIIWLGVFLFSGKSLLNFCHLNYCPAPAVYSFCF